MSQNTRTKSKNLKLAAEQVARATPQSIINGIATQMDRADEAKKRIDEEGIVVKDLKGSVISHPAIKIEADAIKLIANLLKQSEDFC